MYISLFVPLLQMAEVQPASPEAGCLDGEGCCNMPRHSLPFVKSKI